MTRAGAGSRLRLVSVVGARPQFIKAAVLAKAVNALPAARRPRHQLIHTGQHFDAEMSEVFFGELPLPRPAHRLNVGGLEPADQLGRMVERLAAIFRRERPDAVVVYGDTTSTLGGALAASFEGVPCAHVEAGLRSFNLEMPEERNRILTDRLSRWLFCPSGTAVANLAREGMTRGVHLVGDVMVDALMQLERTRWKRQRPLARWHLRPGRYYLATLHRAENTREAAYVAALLEVLGRLDAPTILPLHPRTRNLLRRAGWRAPVSGGLRVVPPLPYHEVLALERGARAVLTDSGGIQKEAHFWGVPCLTLRRETEWVETLEGGWNRLVGTRPEAIRRALALINGGPPAPRQRLYGSGRSAERIVAILLRSLGTEARRLPRTASQAR